MSSINSNFLTNKISSSSLDLSNAQKTLESAKDGLFDINSILSGDSFISTTQGTTFNNAQKNTLANTDTSCCTNNLQNYPLDANGFFTASGSWSSQISQYQQYIAQLEQQIQEYEQQLQEYKTQLETEKANLEATNEKIAIAQQELENYENQKQAKEAEYNRVQAELQQAQYSNENGENDVLINSLSTKLNTLSTEINTINANITNKTCQIQTLQTQACKIETTIAELEEKIDTTETLKTTAELQKCDAQQKLCHAQKMRAKERAKKAAAKKAAEEAAKITDGKSLMSQLSDKDKNYIEKKNIDLTEKKEDGSSRYIIAKGTEDETYHVYDTTMEGINDAGATYNAKSITKTDAGNNWMYNLCESSSGSNVYTVSSVNNDMSDCKYDSTCMSYVTASPLSFDLNGDGVKTSNELIQYDIDGDGKLDTINDSADAILVFDADGDGISGEDGSECFGDNTDLDGDGVADRYKDGFEALKALANKEGLVNGIDDNTLDENDLKILEEKYGLQIKTDGYNSEGKSLFDAGITEINLSTTDETTLHKNYDGQYNDLMTQEGATFVVNGEEREYADIWHAKKDE